jgi:hypothetical protein
MTQLDLFARPPLLTRAEAISTLRPHLGANLRTLSNQFKITIDGTQPHHKGWAGLTVERLLGLPPNNEQAADFGDWELKVIPLRMSAQDTLELKNTLTLTMFQPRTLIDCPFEESHLWEKIRHLLIVCRVYEDPEERRSLIYALCPFDLESSLKEEVHQEYDALRWLMRDRGILGLKQFKGALLSIQPRGEGTGWTFLAQRRFLAQMLSQKITV